MSAVSQTFTAPLPSPSIVHLVPHVPTAPIQASQTSLSQETTLRLPPLTPSCLQLLTEEFPDCGSPTHRPDTPTRQLFDFDMPLSELCPSPNMADKKITNSLDLKLNAVNKKLSVIARQLREVADNQKYMIQLLMSQPRPMPGNFERPVWSAEPLPQPTYPQADIQYTETEFSTDNNMAEAESIATSWQVTPSDDFSDIPVPHRLSIEELNKLKSHSISVNTFATRILVRLYPELFCEDKLRRKFNYYGFRNQKQELDRQRRMYLQRYILYMHPEVRDEKAYQERVVNAINEYLRRP